MKKILLISTAVLALTVAHVQTGRTQEVLKDIDSAYFNRRIVFSEESIGYTRYNSNAPGGQYTTSGSAYRFYFEGTNTALTMTALGKYLKRFPDSHRIYKRIVLGEIFEVTGFLAGIGAIVLGATSADNSSDETMSYVIEGAGAGLVIAALIDRFAFNKKRYKKAIELYNSHIGYRGSPIPSGPILEPQ
jgi:hypothetical protein